MLAWRDGGKSISTLSIEQIYDAILLLCLGDVPPRTLHVFAPGLFCAFTIAVSNELDGLLVAAQSATVCSSDLVTIRSHLDQGLGEFAVDYLRKHSNDGGQGVVTRELHEFDMEAYGRPAELSRIGERLSYLLELGVELLEYISGS